MLKAVQQLVQITKEIRENHDQGTTLNLFRRVVQEDDRPVVSRHQARTYNAEHAFEVPADTRERLLAALKHVTDPLLASLRGHLQACGQVRLVVRFDDGSAEEKTRTFLVPVSESAQINRVLGNLI